MYFLSAVSYFFSHYSFLAMPVIVLLFAILGGMIAAWTKQKAWLVLTVFGFPVGGLNVFMGHFVNALFLNAFGVKGSGVIIHSVETNSTLNDRYIREYDVVLKTADGRDVATKFDTMSASIYPARNEILIPPDGESFVTKYIPGFERNFVIMSDESQYGKERLIREDLEPVQKAEAQLAVSPANPAFIQEYRTALEKFIHAHRNDADPDLIRDCEEKLEALGPSSK